MTFFRYFTATEAGGPAFALLEAFLLDHAAHVGRQAFEPILVVGFGDFAYGLPYILGASNYKPSEWAALYAMISSSRE